MLVHGPLSLILSPRLRGAPDDVRDGLEGCLRSAIRAKVASQQVADRGVVNALASIRSERRGGADVLVEADYLSERQPVAADLVWGPGGDREKNRQCLLALLRAGLAVRADNVGGSLQHVNMVIADAAGDGGRVFLTSANFSPGSIERHFNWALILARGDVAEALSRAFEQAWDGDIRDVEVMHPIKSEDKDLAQLAIGGRGQAIDLAVNAIAGARETIRFAYFNMALKSRVVDALAAAGAQGIDVAGIVDADQASLTWNAVPALRAAGVKALYYPGALTGAVGRMHYKMLAIDDSLAHLSSANASTAAETSLELSISINGEAGASGPARFLSDEIARLAVNAFPA